MSVRTHPRAQKPCTRLRRTAIGALAVPLLTAVACGSAGRHAARKGARAPVQHRPAFSPAGFPLGSPAFVLRGLAALGAPVANAVPVRLSPAPRAGLLVDLTNGRVLWQRNALVPLRIASLTKMMTALVAVRAEPPDATVLVHKDDVEVAGSKVGVLPVGRRVPLESMLYGLMLPSGNDAAEAIAEHVARTVPRFVRLMNEEAARLGLECTRYSSPSGYIDARNFSCAADLAVLAHVLLAQPRLARIVRTYYAVLPFPIKGGKLYLRNINPLLRYHYAGLTGIKTGETDAAGKCFVATARRHGVSLAAVLLASPAPARQARELLDGAFEDVYGQRHVPEQPLPPGA
jgi:serine-type D-Ala-D-Ala carboxypeptidase (penicillin-binding protein 5/6)